MTSKPGWKTITIHICHDVKATRQWKLGQVIENNKRNVFVQKFYEK